MLPSPPPQSVPCRTHSASAARWDFTDRFATMPRQQPKNAHHVTSTAPKNPQLVPFPRASLARTLVRGLLARLGPREFPPSLRHRRNPHLHRPLRQQRTPNFQPSHLLSPHRYRLDPRRSRQTNLRPPPDRRHRISFRLHHPALGPPALALPHRPAVHPALVAQPPRLRSSRLETAIRHIATSPDRLALRHPQPKSEFRRARSLPPSLLRPRPHAPRHHFPLPRLRGLFPHALALHPSVSPARGTRRPPDGPKQTHTIERIE